MSQNSETRTGVVGLEEERRSERSGRDPGSSGGAPARGSSVHQQLDGAASSRREPVDTQEVSLLELANVLLKRWKFVAGVPLAAAVVAAVISLLVPPMFTATASFVPEVEGTGLNLPTGLAGIAAQFGVAVPGGGSRSPAFYADVLRSRTLRDELLLAGFADPRSDPPADSASLLDILEISGATQAGRLESGRRMLDAALSVRVDNATNVVSVSVETRYAALSADVANLCIALLNRFNLVTRQSNAQERRRFVEERMAEAERELRTAEDDLKKFLERNRQFRGSPELTFEYERLQRQVTIKQEVFTTLRRSYEEARIQEVNDTPVITVIDRAVTPNRKSSPKRKLNVMLAFMVGGVLSVIGAFGREFMERSRERGDEEFEEFSSRWAGVKAELRNWSPLSRRRGSTREQR